MGQSVPLSSMADITNQLQCDLPLSQGTSASSRQPAGDEAHPGRKSLTCSRSLDRLCPDAGLPLFQVNLNTLPGPPTGPWELGHLS